MACPYCKANDFNCVRILDTSVERQKYDYKETVVDFYYQCTSCDQISNSQIITTTLRRIPGGIAKRAQNMANLEYN
jgi:hypothetical protein